MDYLGGLVNIIPEDVKAFDTKTRSDLPTNIYTFVSKLLFPINNEIISSKSLIFGSSRIKIQPYYGDIDGINRVEINANKQNAGKIIVLQLQNIIRNIKNNGYFFTDMKCGRYKSGKSIHWTYLEVLNGFRDGKYSDINGNKGENVALYDAIMQNPLKKKETDDDFMIKIDMVVPFNSRYMEVSMLYLIYTKNYEYLFFNAEFLLNTRTISTLVNDIAKQKEKNKPFKIVKRLFSIIRFLYGVYNDKTVIKYNKLLVPIIGSNISRLSSINSDLSTIKLLYETKQENINLNFLHNSLQSFKDRYNSITDLDSVIDNINTLNNHINKLSELIYTHNFSKIINELDILINIINKMIIYEITLYFKSKNISFNSFINIICKYAIHKAFTTPQKNNFFNINHSELIKLQQAQKQLKYK